MFFDTNEIHIQAFLLFINGKLIIFNPHLHKKYFANIYSNQKKTKILVPRTYGFRKFSKCCEVQIDKNNICPGWFHIFSWFFEAFWWYSGGLRVQILTKCSKFPESFKKYPKMTGGLNCPFRKNINPPKKQKYNKY